MATTPYAFRPSPYNMKVKSGTTVAPGMLLKVSASEEVDLCGAGEGNLAIGIATDTVVGDGVLLVGVVDRNTPGLVQLNAAGAVVAAAAIYCAASGKADDAASGLKIGYAVTACSNANDVFWAKLNSDNQ